MRLQGQFFVLSSPHSCLYYRAVYSQYSDFFLAFLPCFLPQVHCQGRSAEATSCSSQAACASLSQSPITAVTPLSQVQGPLPHWVAVRELWDHRADAEGCTQPKACCLLPHDLLQWLAPQLPCRSFQCRGVEMLKPTWAVTGNVSVGGWGNMTE